MKKTVLLTLALMLMLSTPSFARPQCHGHFCDIVNDCVDHPVQMNDHERFDYGLYLDLILYQSEDDSFEIGMKNTYEHERAEFTSLLGAKINVYNIFFKK